MGSPDDLTGEVFERLTVLHKDAKRSANGGLMWVCQCTCGNTTSVRADSLKIGVVKSCGCF
jgi:hypothetical protein